MTGDEKKIRWFEAEILDKEYLKYPFLQYNEEIVIPHLLKIFGDIERDELQILKKGYSNTNLTWLLVKMLLGIGHAIRWINLMPTTGQINSEVSYKAADDMAAELLTSAINYYRISQEFVAWSRGLVTAEIDEEKKTIRFSPPNGYDFHQLILNDLQFHAQTQDSDVFPYNEAIPEFRKWFKEIDLFNPPLGASMDWGLALESQTLPVFLEQLNAIILPECPPETDLAGYTLAEYRKFYALLSINFHFIRWSENIMDQIQEENPFGSNPIRMEMEEAYLFYSQITDLSPGVIKAIITDLTFDHHNFHTSLLIQPFVRSRNNQLYILPNSFPMVDANRMLTGALNKGVKKPIYDRLINKIEQQQLNGLVALFTGLGMSVIKEHNIKILGRIFTPDLIVIDRKSRRILIIDYKHFLSPLGASEVHYRMKEIDKAIKQVSNYQKFIPNSRFMQELIKNDIHDFNFTGMILFNSPMVVLMPSTLDILISDLFSLKQLISQLNGDISAVLTHIKKPFKPGFEKEKFNFYDEEISVDDWKVLFQIYAIKKADRK